MDAEKSRNGKGEEMMEYGLERVSKGYNGQPVLDCVTLRLHPGRPVCVMGPSGCGKTTLLRLLMGLEQPEEGRVLHNTNQCMGVMFQEDRLLEWTSPVKNVQTVCDRKPEEIREHLKKVLPEDALEKNVKNLSGGMKRRVALVRAVMAPARILLLDEPFTGLDESTKKRAAGYLMEYLEDRILIFSSHQERDAGYLKAEVFKMENIYKKI
ncbi:MAG: ATP-binding cassette domain-containing protein [Ruminococcus sp.]|jgi:NitT/TauT family transport system ATP-binding protein